MTKKTFKGKLDQIKIAEESKSPLKIEQNGVANLADAKLIRIDLIFENPNQPRKKFNEKKLRELADSIKDRGILQPIRVRPLDDGYQIVAGERRWRSAKIAGLTEVPAIVCNQSDEDAYTDAIIENIQREDLNAIDRANALRQLRVNLGLPSWEAVGQKVGLTKQHVLNLIGLEALPKNIQEEIRSEGLTEKHGRALRTLQEKPELFNELHEQIKKNELSGDQSLALARSLKSKNKRVEKELKAISKMSSDIISVLSIMDFSLLEKEDTEKLCNTIQLVQEKVKDLLEEKNRKEPEVD